VQSNADLRDLVLNNAERRRPLFLSPFNEDFAFVTHSVRNSVEHRLHTEEARILSPRASASRRSEFLLGRTAAYLALKQLGFDSPPPVLQGERREPLWPEGIVGSITHCESWAIVAAARRSVALTIGIDLESAATIQTDDIGALICHDTERDWVAEDGDCRERLMMVFSAKEAAFKALYPLCKRFIDFKEVRLRWIPKQAGFRGELLTSLNPDFTRGYEFDVGCSRNGDLILTHMVLLC
jgi:4'-phosphopantetheinyl transferase EntD